MIQNITFTDTSPAMAAPEPEAPRLRLRRVAVSPAEEYALRPGAARPISNDLAAAILSRKGRAEFTIKGIVIERADMGGRHTYYHPDSKLCNDLSTRERKLYYVVNPHQKDLAHILDENGHYLETLPIKERPAVLDTEAQARVAAGHRRHINRAAARLQHLHGADTKERLAELAANSSEMQRVVQTLPAPGSDPASPVQPARSTHGEAATAGARRINDLRANQASAIAIGRALAANRREPVDLADLTDLTDHSEDWTGRHSPQQHHQPQQLAEIESW